MYKKVFFILACVTFLFPNFVLAQVTINDYDAVNYFKDKKSATVTGNTVSIFDYSERKVIGVDHQNKTYYEASWDEYSKEYIDYMRGAQDRQKEMMMKKTGMTEEGYNAMMKKQMQMMKSMSENMKQQQGSMEIKIENAGTEKVAGYDCIHYVITNHGRPVQDVWVSPAVDALIENEIGSQALEEAEEMANEMQAEMKKISAQTMKDMGMDEDDMEGGDVEKARAEIEEKGYLMMSREMDGMFGGMNQYEDPVCDVSISTGNIDNSVFRVPAGYKEVPVKEFLITQVQSGMEDDMSDEDAQKMAEFYGAMDDTDDSGPGEMDINDIKVCSAGVGKSFSLNLSGDGEKEPVELDAILKKNTEMGFEFQDIQTCSYIPSSKIFGVKINGSSVQGALFYKGEKEYIQVILSVSKDKADEGSSIEAYYVHNPGAGGKPEKTTVQGHEIIYATSSDLAGRTNQKVEVLLGKNVSLMVILANVNGKNDFSVKLIDWVNEAFDFSKFEDPDWM
ncbi:MAG: hypothetical protein B6D64_05505 [Bacteroidetes bacterium 4484_276]|nr:MAG: hypothetical protein B6D64_05505 [Bacteroidetes bacterium 4484_276]